MLEQLNPNCRIFLAICKISSRGGEREEYFIKPGEAINQNRGSVVYLELLSDVFFSTNEEGDSDCFAFDR